MYSDEITGAAMWGPREEERGEGNNWPLIIVSGGRQLKLTAIQADGSLCIQHNTWGPFLVVQKKVPPLSIFDPPRSVACFIFNTDIIQLTN